MMGAMKEMATKHVGPYRVHLWHIDDNKAAMGIFAHNVNRQLHNTGTTDKAHATKLYNAMKTPEQVEKFLNSSKIEGHHGSLLNVHSRY